MLLPSLATDDSMFSCWSQYKSLWCYWLRTVPSNLSIIDLMTLSSSFFFFLKLNSTVNPWFIGVPELKVFTTYKQTYFQGSPPINNSPTIQMQSQNMINIKKLEKTSLRVYFACWVYFLVNKKKSNLKENVTWHVVYLCLTADGMVLHGERDEMPHAWLEWKDFEQVVFLGS